MRMRKGATKLMNRQKEGGMSPMWEEEIRRTKEDREGMEGMLYGCSSFFFSDIRFFLAASIS